MKGRRPAAYGTGAVALLVLAAAGWLFSLPSAQRGATLSPTSSEEMAAVVAALKPPKRRRPVVAIVGANDGTETTDYLMPYGILHRADVAEVVALGMRAGPVELYPALTVEPQATVDAFDQEYPDGADYLIVPAIRRDDDPAVLRWIREQAGKGAIVIGVCAGAKVVANAGLLDGRRATTHWYYVDEMRKEHPSIRYVPDTRYVADGDVVTSTGISASMPLSLVLIEAMAGREKAQEVAEDLGVRNWDARHDSSAFRFARPFAWTALRNRLAFWTHERLGMRLAPGADEVALALVADAWSRTYRSRMLMIGDASGAVRSRSGLSVHADRAAKDWDGIVWTMPAGQTPTAALEQALRGISGRYGKATADFVAMQLEYSGQGEGEAAQ